MMMGYRALVTAAVLLLELVSARAQDFTINPPVRYDSGVFSHTGALLSLAPVGAAGTYTKATVDPFGRVTGGAAAACSDLSDDGTACVANTGTSLHTLGFLDENKTDSGNNIFSGTNSHAGLEKFTNVTGANRQVVDPATTDTLSALDCGKSVVYHNTSPLTVSTFATSLAAAEACAVAIVQKGTGAVNVAAGGGTVINSLAACTKVAGRYALASLYVSGDAPTEWLLGGSCSP